MVAMALQILPEAFFFSSCVIMNTLPLQFSFLCHNFCADRSYLCCERRRHRSYPAQHFELSPKVVRIQAIRLLMALPITSALTFHISAIRSVFATPFFLPSKSNTVSNCFSHHLLGIRIAAVYFLHHILYL